MLLWHRFLDNKVLLSLGKAFKCKEPGWFRLVFSDKAHRLRLGKRSALPAPPKCILPLPSFFWPHIVAPATLACSSPPTHISADRAFTSPSQGCRGSGRCYRAHPRWQKTPLPVRHRSSRASTGELVAALRLLLPTRGIEGCNGQPCLSRLPGR